VDQVIGAVRADLQLTALELVRDVQFLVPAIKGDCKWSKALVHLTEWLATPAISNIAAARRQLLELAEGISPDDIANALGKGHADIELDPPAVNPNQTIRMTVRFRDERLNTAMARNSVRCEWRFLAPKTNALLRKWQGRNRGAAHDANPGANQDGTDREQVPAPVQSETAFGFRINRYFEPDIVEQVVEARFYCKGTPINVEGTTNPVVCSRTIAPGQSNRIQADRWERRIWRHAPQVIGLGAALLVPLATLAITTTTGDVSSSHWWDLVGLGFGSETIRNILTGQTSS